MNKNKYTVTIEEIISEDFEVTADTEEEAAKIAEKKYRNGEFVLEPGKLISKQMQINNLTDNEITEWIEFNEFILQYYTFRRL